MYSNLGASLLKPKFHVDRLMIREIGTYNPQYLRSYNMDSSEGRADRLLERIERSSVIDGNMLAGISGDVISQSAAPTGEIKIVNGWDHRRFAWIMEVVQINTTGSETVTLLQGYTDRADYSLQGNLNPNTEFVINSFITLNRTRNHRTGETHDVVTEAANVVNGKFVTTYSDRDELLSMRPEDLIQGIESSHLREAYSQYGGGKFDDRRIAPVGSGSILSRRRNSMPSTYLANTLDSYRNSSSLGDFGIRERDLLGHTINSLLEPTAGDLDFLRALAEVQRIPGTTSFRLSDLEDIDRDLRSPLISKDRIKLIELTAAERGGLHRTNDTESFEAAKVPQWAATVFANSVSSIMMDLYIVRLEVQATNSSRGGRVEIRVTQARSLMNIDLTEQVAMLKRRMEFEVLKDISNGNRETYYITASLDLFGETRLKIDIADSGEIPFCVPSFGDSVMIPSMTGSREHFTKTVGDMEYLLGEVNNVTRRAGTVPVSSNL